MPSKKPAKVKKSVKKPATKQAKVLKQVPARIAAAAKRLVSKKVTPAKVVASKQTKALAKPVGKKVAVVKTPLKVAPSVVAAKKVVSAKKAAPVVDSKITDKKTKPGKGGKVIAIEVSSTVAVKKGKSVSAIPVKTSKELKKRCREALCDHDVVVTGYCRLHYIKNWRKIKRKEAILATGQLNNYVEELVSKYPDKYLDVIRQDLGSEKDWSKVVVDLELDSTDDDFGGDEEDATASEGSTRRDRDFDDDSESF